MFRIVVFIACLVNLNFAYSNTLGAVVAKVTDVGTYGDGSIYVFFDQTVSPCGSDNKRVDIEYDHLAKSHVFSLAMTAYSADSHVKLKVAACKENSADFTDDKKSYFYLTG